MLRRLTELGSVYVYLTGEVKMNSLLLEIVFTFRRKFYCYAKTCYLDIRCYIVFEAGLKAVYPCQFFYECCFAGHWSQQLTCRISAFCNNRSILVCRTNYSGRKAPSLKMGSVCFCRLGVELSQCSSYYVTVLYTQNGRRLPGLFVSHVRRSSVN